MRPLACFAAVLLKFCYAYPIEFHGTDNHIVGHDIWGDTENEAVVLITENAIVWVDEGALLEILPGVQVLFQSNLPDPEDPDNFTPEHSSHLMLAGNIMAIGTPDAPITFTHDVNHYFVPSCVSWDTPTCKFYTWGNSHITSLFANLLSPMSWHFEFCKFSELPTAIVAEPFYGIIEILDCEFYNCGTCIWVGRGALSEFETMVVSRSLFHDADPPPWNSNGGSLVTEFFMIANFDEFDISNCLFRKSYSHAWTEWNNIGRNRIEQAFHFRSSYSPELCKIRQCQIEVPGVVEAWGGDDARYQGETYLSVSENFRVSSPTLANNYFVSPLKNHGRYWPVANARQNMMHDFDIHDVLWMPDGYDEDFRDNNILVEQGTEIKFPITSNGHLVYEPEVRGAEVDGINDGTALYESYRDRDGTEPDIGVFGGPDIPLDSAYVIIPFGDAIPPDGYYTLPETVPAATCRLSRSFEVSASGSTNLMPGSKLVCDPGARVRVAGVGTTLNCGGTSTSLNSFSGFGGERWGGLEIVDGGSLVGGYLEVGGARTGIRVRNPEIALSSLEVQDCITGIKFENSNQPDGISLAHATVSACETGIALVNSGVDLSGTDLSIEVSGNSCGISVVSNSSLYASDLLITDCFKEGLLATNGSSVELTNCAITRNGGGLRQEGGVVSLLGSDLRVKCSEVTGNHGAGVFVQDGNLTMQDIDAQNQWGGNDISGNHWFGQIDVRSGHLHMERGYNHVRGPVPEMPPLPPLIWYERRPNDVTGIVPVNGNAWGYGAGQAGQIIARLQPSQNFDTDPFTYIAEASWQSCDEVETPPFSNCEIDWNTAMTYMKAKEYEDAALAFKDVIADETCKFAKDAADQLLIAEKLAGTSNATVRNYLLTTAASADSADVRVGLAKAAAMAAANDEDWNTALSELDSLAEDSETGFKDSLAIRMSYHTVEYLAAVSDTSDTLGHDVHFDTLMVHLDLLMELGEEPFTMKPTIDYSDVDALDRGSAEHSISADAYADDSVAIEVMMLDYRFHPTGSWVHDTLEQQTNDTTWEIEISLDSLGGGIEYRLLAIDTLGRVETWPGTDGYPNLNDTLTHFVSFEPHLTAPLTDTAYVYAPGVISENIEIGDGGVLYVLPAPVAMDSYVVAIDSGVGISLYREELTRPKLVVAGTDSAEITMTCSSVGDKWNGITSHSGFVQIDNAVFEKSIQPLFTEKSSGACVVRVTNAQISEFTEPVYLSFVEASGPDSSIFSGVNITGGGSDGMRILAGPMIIEDVEISGCDGNGLEIGDCEGQLLNSVAIKNNGGHGLITLEESGAYVRMEDCTIAFNGDTLAEIKVFGNSVLDFSAGAGNVIKDSTGVLVECEETDDFDSELGSNSFVLVDSTGKYLSVNAMTSSAYITGNSFYPASVSDSTFIDEHMKQDTLSKWVYSYLRAENQMDEVIEDPNGSIDFELKVYVQNYLGTVASDTITEVGFKYKVLPDQSSWTTQRQTTIEADSIYDWTVSVGDQGGLISYIWWVKDAHGRYLTCPAGADTTTPDSGATHFLSFEMADYLIESDTVVIWAPTVLTHDIQIGYGGRLVIKPWPGATDHTIRLADSVMINISPTSCCVRPMMWILGTEDMPITIEAMTDTSRWWGIYNWGGDLSAQYTTFRSTLVALDSGLPPFWEPVIMMDHCTFETSDGYFIAWGTQLEHSYLRNCVFRGFDYEVWRAGAFNVVEGDIEVSDCWFYGNQYDGVGLWDARETQFNGCNFVSNGMSGLYCGSSVTSADLNCCEFSYNGSDSMPEVYVEEGFLDFSNDATCVFADKSGTLLEGPSVASFDVDSGGNGFYLFDSTGTYILTGDVSDTMMIRGNFWYPWTPDTSIFQDYFDPDTSRFWNWNNPVEELASCESGLSSLPGGDAIALVRPTEGTFSMPGRNSKSRASSKTALASKSSFEPSLKQAVDLSLYEVGAHAQQMKAYELAATKYAEFINTNTDNPKAVSALSRHIVSSIKANQTDGLSAFYDRIAQRSLNKNVQRTAKFLRLEALALEGRPQDAISGYDEIITKPESTKDSVAAVVNSMQLLFRDRDAGQLSTRFPENRAANVVDLVRRMNELTYPLRKRGQTSSATTNQPAIPSAYQLYQNFPNPFNPNTEIRFDIPEVVKVELKIFNILGQEVATLADDVRAAGAYRILWDGKNAGGISVASGVYVYQLKAGNFQDAKKMVLVR